VERFEEICRNASAIHRARPDDYGWLNLRWCMEYKGGSPNWWKVVNGQFAWMMKPEKSNGGQPKRDINADIDAAIAAVDKKGKS